MSAALPQVYASEEELAQTDSLRATEQFFQQQHQLAQTQQAQNGGGYTQQQQQQYSPASSQQMQQSYRSPSHSQSIRGQTPPQQQSQRSPFQQSARNQLHAQDFYSGGHVQRPQTGIASIPKEQQSHWQSMLQSGPTTYGGASIWELHMSSHLPTRTPASGHADGPQHIEYPPGATLADAPHRQAWSSQPTFRWHKRSDYDDVADRWSKREGLKGRGDNTYRPLSVREQAEINARVERRKQTKGQPRTGEW